VRYLLAARVRPEQRMALLRALTNGSFGRGFPYGDLGEVLCKGRVDDSGVIRWVEVCYCREYYGVAMHEELPYLEEYLTDIEVADARSPLYCEGYPECHDCDCTRKVKFAGEPLLDHLSHTIAEPSASLDAESRPTRWLGWQGRITPEEAQRNGTECAGTSHRALSGVTLTHVVPSTPDSGRID
jgi:hypothetical protein